MGDRFGRQGKAQLQAVLDAREAGLDVAPVWNKSHREHTLIGTMPLSLREEADGAVESLGYAGPYFVDADHITMDTVDGFIKCSDFFTLDVAESLGREPSSPETAEAYRSALEAMGEVVVPGLDAVLAIDSGTAGRLLATYGAAVEAARDLYRKISAAHPDGDFAIEVSMDETDNPQGPIELLGILRLLALEGVPVQTIAPKFTGRFNKGVDYVGDLTQFQAEFELDLLVLKYAIHAFNLPLGLKLSVHSGSDKFSLYPIIKELVFRHEAGLHMKTAGTTWLEEVIGLADSGGEGLEFIKQIYSEALEKFDELTAPYATVLDIDRKALPSADEARQWSGQDVTGMVEHNVTHPQFNSSLRQLFHVAFKLAAQTDKFYRLLDENADFINRRVHDNLLRKHIMKVYPAIRKN